MVAIASSSPTSIASAASFGAVRILADDLTGACDAAAPFLRAGQCARVWLGPVAAEDTSEVIQSFNTATRNEPREGVVQTVMHAARAFRQDSGTLVFRKVDSAGRGHFEVEVLAAHWALGTRAVLFAPSFPAAGRTVREGILHVSDGFRSDTIPLLTRFQPLIATALITSPSQVQPALDSGAQVLVCDAQFQWELEALSAMALPGLLYAGSAGLAGALAGRVCGTAAQEATMPEASSALTICGSTHAVTEAQINHLATAAPHHPVLRIHDEAADNANILKHFAEHDPDALMLTGGDTALLVLTTLGASSILLQGELAPGIPWGRIQGGVAHGRIVITKSGGFGAPDALTQIVTGLA